MAVVAKWVGVEGGLKKPGRQMAIGGPAGLSWYVAGAGACLFVHVSMHAHACVLVLRGWWGGGSGGWSAGWGLGRSRQVGCPCREGAGRQPPAAA